MPTNEMTLGTDNIVSMGEFRSDNNQVGGTGNGSKNENIADDPFIVKLMRGMREINTRIDQNATEVHARID